MIMMMLMSRKCMVYLVGSDFDPDAFSTLNLPQNNVILFRTHCTNVPQRREQVVCFCAVMINPLNAELNPICHLLALLGAHPILHVSKIKDNFQPRL
jgi:hypothetical protein